MIYWQVIYIIIYLKIIFNYNLIKYLTIKINKQSIYTGAGR